MTTAALVLLGWTALVVVLLVLWRAACAVARSPSEGSGTVVADDVPQQRVPLGEDRAAT